MRGKTVFGRPFKLESFNGAFVVDTSGLVILSAKQFRRMAELAEKHANEEAGK